MDFGRPILPRWPLLSSTLLAAWLVDGERSGQQLVEPTLRPASAEAVAGPGEPLSDVAAVPRSKYGPRLHALVAWLKYGLGMTLGKIHAFLWEQCGLELSTGVLSEILTRVGRRLTLPYDALVEAVRRQSVLYADESGWRVDGVNHYLWVFPNDKPCVYQIRRSRGSQVLLDLLGKRFGGVLCSDFYVAYGVIEGPKQKCLVHLMRDLRKLRATDEDPVAQAFSRKLIAALKRVFKLHGAREQMPVAAFDKQVKATRTRILNLAFDHLKSSHADCC